MLVRLTSNVIRRDGVVEMRQTKDARDDNPVLIRKANSKLPWNIQDTDRKHADHSNLLRQGQIQFQQQRQRQEHNHHVQGDIQRRHDLESSVAEACPFRDTVESRPVVRGRSTVERALEDDCDGVGRAQDDQTIGDAFEGAGGEDAEIEE